MPENSVIRPRRPASAPTPDSPHRHCEETVVRVLRELGEAAQDLDLPAGIEVTVVVGLPCGTGAWASTVADDRLVEALVRITPTRYPLHELSSQTHLLLSDAFPLDNDSPMRKMHSNSAARPSHSGASRPP